MARKILGAGALELVIFVTHEYYPAEIKPWASSRKSRCMGSVSQAIAATIIKRGLASSRVLNQNTSSFFCIYFPPTRPIRSRDSQPNAETCPPFRPCELCLLIAQSACHGGDEWVKQRSRISQLQSTCTSASTPNRQKVCSSYSQPALSSSRALKVEEGEVIGDMIRP